MKINVVGMPPVVVGIFVSLIVLLVVTAVDPKAKVIALGQLETV